MTQAERRAATRERLIHAAADVFASDGFLAASVERVTDAADLSRGSFYAHFSSKDDLLLAVLDTMLGQVDSYVSGALERDPTGPALFEALKEVRIGNSRGDQRWLALYGELRQQALRDETLRARLTEHQRRIQATVAALIEAQATALNLSLPARSDHLALIVLALDEGYTVLRATDEELPDDAFLTTLTLLFDSFAALATKENSSRK